MSSSPFLKPNEGPVVGRERRRSSSALSSGLAEVTHGRDKLVVKMSVENYVAEEISVRVEEGQIFVTGKNTKENHGNDAALKSFSRKIPIPQGMDGAGLKWEISPDKVLTITVPRKGS